MNYDSASGLSSHLPESIAGRGLSPRRGRRKGIGREEAQKIPSAATFCAVLWLLFLGSAKKELATDWHGSNTDVFVNR
jgi:hypothetical protein